MTRADRSPDHTFTTPDPVGSLDPEPPTPVGAGHAPPPAPARAGRTAVRR